MFSNHVSIFRFLLFTLAVLTHVNAQGIGTCYDDRDYPAIADLAETKEGYRILLSGRFRKSDGTAPMLEFRQGRGWKNRGNRSCLHPPCDRVAENPCPPLPEIHISRTEARRLLGRRLGTDLEQTPEACIRQGRYIYFGINAYRGEGNDSVGGIGRYDPRSGKMEIRRPVELRETNVTHLAMDGKTLWIGTGGDYECAGTVPTKGLLGYDWDDDHLVSDMRGEKNMCGFLVRGSLVRGDTLVVATDTGLAIREKDAGNDAEYHWRHFVPDLHHPRLMRETDCDTLHEQLLRTASRVRDGVGWESFEQTFDALVALRPGFLERFIRRELEARKDAGHQRASKRRKTGMSP
jgi:hypothetical protein